MQNGLFVSKLKKNVLKIKNMYSMLFLSHDVLYGSDIATM